MTLSNLFQKITNYFIFKGNVNRIGFIGTLFFAAIMYILISDIAIENRFYLRLSGIYMGIVFCYLYGIAIAARLRNMKLNPSIAYFFVILLWIAHFVVLGCRPISRDFTTELVFMLELFTILPLFAKNKKILQFWKV